MIFCSFQYNYSVTPGGWHYEYSEAVIDITERYYNNGDKQVHRLDTGGVPLSNMEIGGHYSTVDYAYIASKTNEADGEIKSLGVYNL